MDWKGHDGSERSWEQVRRHRVSSHGGACRALAGDREKELDGRDIEESACWLWG